MNVREWAAEFNPEALFADGFDDAIVGMAERCSQEPVVVYDVARCLAILVDQGMDLDEAEEFFHYNTLGAWVGPNTPLFLWRPAEGGL